MRSLSLTSDRKHSITSWVDFVTHAMRILPRPVMKKDSDLDTKLNDPNLAKTKTTRVTTSIELKGTHYLKLRNRNLNYKQIVQTQCEIGSSSADLFHKPSKFCGGVIRRKMLRSSGNNLESSSLKQSLYFSPCMGPKMKEVGKKCLISTW